MCNAHHGLIRELVSEVRRLRAEVEALNEAIDLRDMRSSMRERLLRDDLRREAAARRALEERDFERWLEGLRIA